MNDFVFSVTGWLFIGAALMLWFGWTLLPVRLGPFFESKDFGEVYSRLRLWIWLYRIHMFGYLVTVMAFAALAAIVVGSDSRILVWPAVAVLTAGLIVAALAAAFYYHFGAWGAISMKGQSGSRIQSFVDSLHVGTEYITCLVRFGRVFFGLGQVMLAIGLFQGEILPLWLIGGAGILGLAAMVVTMAFPDNLEYYWPLFHLNAVWLAGIGIVVLTSGITLGG
jgi:hypothetical protein